MNLKFRLLRADEVEARVATVNDRGCSILLYKDARVDMNILDETLGPFNWKRDHKMIGDRLYCTVSIYDAGKNEWISKTDVGTESYTEKEKGQASDSFKRACFNIGIGRELYTAPFIWVNASEYESEKNGNRIAVKDRFKVSSIGYDNRGRINSLAIVRKGRKGGADATVFTYGNASFYDVIPPDSSEPAPATKRNKAVLYSLCNKDTNRVKEVCEQVGCSDPEKITAEQCAAAMEMIRNGS